MKGKPLKFDFVSSFILNNEIQKKLDKKTTKTINLSKSVMFWGPKKTLFCLRNVLMTCVNGSSQSQLSF